MDSVFTLRKRAPQVSRGRKRGGINVKNAFSEHAELRATRLSQARHTPSLSFPVQYSRHPPSIRGRFQSRDNHPSTSNPSSIGSARPPTRRGQICPSLSSPNLLIRTTIGITSATPSAMVSECTTLQMRARGVIAPAFRIWLN